MTTTTTAATPNISPPVATAKIQVLTRIAAQPFVRHIFLQHTCKCQALYDSFHLKVVLKRRPVPLVNICISTMVLKTENQRPRGLDALLGHLSDRSKLSLYLIEM